MSDLAWSRKRCEELDAADPLAHVRDRFVVPDGLCYLDGNSLGVLPKGVPERLQRLVEHEWAADLVRGWDEWIGLPEKVGNRIARLIGAGEGEVIVVDTTNIALVKLLGAALGLRPERHVILTTKTNFPTDLYATEAVARIFGAEVRYAEPEDVAKALDDSVAVVSLTHVDFRTGFMFDMAGLTRAAHDAGAVTVWDLCHSVGSVVVECERDSVDLAVGCTYKYLNAGPGSPAFLYVRRELQDVIENPFPGWLGHEAPFDFAPVFRPAPGIRRFVTSSPSILGISALDAALDAWEGVQVSDVRAKSVQMSEMFVSAVRERLGDELPVASPPDPADRGSQIALRHEHAYEIVQALIARGVIGDFRAPDLCRFGFTPLYLRFTDVFDAVEHIEAVMEHKEYLEDRFSERRAVT